MFNSKKPEPDALDKAIADAHAFLADADDDSEEYAKGIDNLSKLYKMKESLKDPGNRVSKDALVAAGASIGSIVLILIFEGVGRGIITSKSLGFVQKPKI